MFNLVNLHLYHYAGNNPVKYTDPDGNQVAEAVLLGEALSAAGATGAMGVAASSKKDQDLAKKLEATISNWMKDTKRNIALGLAVGKLLSGLLSGEVLAAAAEAGDEPETTDGDKIKSDTEKAKAEREKEIASSIPTIRQPEEPPPSLDPEENPPKPMSKADKAKFIIIGLLKLFGKDPGSN